MNFRLQNLNIDPIIFVSVSVLFSLGLIAIYSSGYAKGDDDLVLRQAFWFFAGIFVLSLSGLYRMKDLLQISNFLYALLLFMLVLLAIFGSVKMGAKRWLVIGPLQFQPSEAGKLFLLCALARFYSEGKINWSDGKKMLGGFLLTLIPAVIILKEPDLGSFSIYLLMYFFVVYLAGLPYFSVFNVFSIIYFVFAKSLGYQLFLSSLVFYGASVFRFSKTKINALMLFIFALVVSFGSGLIWDNLKSYQKTRIMTFIDPEKFSTEGGWQVVQAKTAVFNGGLTGEGFLSGSQTQLRFLPEGHNDFIFSVIAEELGMAGVVILLSAFSLLFYRMSMIVSKVKSRYLYLLGSGVTAMLMFQTVLNIFINIGIMPVTGLTLPFVSYGGSSLVINMLMIGIVTAIGRQEKVI
jgi:rod shape determining protein RodA